MCIETFMSVCRMVDGDGLQKVGTRETEGKEEEEEEEKEEEEEE